jgi:hypothetical protein
MVYERGRMHPRVAPAARLTVAALVYLASVLGYPTKTEPALFR